jgi:hypothetical protein
MSNTKRQQEKAILLSENFLMAKKIAWVVRAEYDSEFLGNCVD